MKNHRPNRRNSPVVHYQLCVPFRTRNFTTSNYSPTTQCGDVGEIKTGKFTDIVKWMETCLSKRWNEIARCSSSGGPIIWSALFHKCVLDYTTLFHPVENKQRNRNWLKGLNWQSNVDIQQWPDYQPWCFTFLQQPRWHRVPYRPRYQCQLQQPSRWWQVCSLHKS